MNHWLSVDWKPSHTLKAKATGPRMERTTRKKVRIVSIVWDGFQSTLSQWFTRYISVYLWLPVSDLFSCMLAKIQVLMLQNDILELQNNPNYSLDNSNSVYVIFMLIGIIGYFTVPTVAGWIVQAGGAGNYSRNINRTATKAGGFAAGAAGSALGNIGGRLRGK